MRAGKRTRGVFVGGWQWGGRRQAGKEDSEAEMTEAGDCSSRREYAGKDVRQRTRRARARSSMSPPPPPPASAQEVGRRAGAAVAPGESCSSMPAQQTLNERRRHSKEQRQSVLKRRATSQLLPMSRPFRYSPQGCLGAREDCQAAVQLAILHEYRQLMPRRVTPGNMSTPMMSIDIRYDIELSFDMRRGDAPPL